MTPSYTWSNQCSVRTDRICRSEHGRRPGRKTSYRVQMGNGRPLAGHISPPRYHQLGAIMASLHNHAESLRIPTRSQPKRWDNVFYYRNAPVVYNTTEYRHLFAPEQVDLIDHAIAHVGPFLANLCYELGEPFIIHADLNPWNVHIHRGRLYVIDVEDVALGYPFQDIAICLYCLRHAPDYAELAAAFQAGYTTGHPWPSFSQRDLHRLWVARIVNFINYAAHTDDPQSATAFINARCQELERYLSTTTDVPQCGSG